MGGRKQPEDAHRKKRITPGRILTLLVAAVAVVYLFISIHTFYNFVHIMLTDPDAAKQQENTIEALDEAFGGEE